MSADMPEADGSQASPAPDPWPDDNRAQWARAVMAELERLPVDQATLVRLVYVHRLPLSHAAARMRLRLEPAGRSLSIGMRTLALALEGQQPGGVG